MMTHSGRINMGKIFIPKENLKIEPMLRHPLTELLRDKERLDFLLNRAYAIQINEGDIVSSREKIDNKMKEQNG